MVTAKFGSKQFKVTSKMIYTPDGFSMSESIDIEETERSGKKPSTKVKGIKLQTASFSVILDARFVTIATEINWWRNTLRAKASKDLYYGNYKIGRFYLTQVDVAEVNINKSGVYTRAKLTLSFTEDTKSTSSTSSKSSSSKSNSSASSVKSSASSKKSSKFRAGSQVKVKTGSYGYPSASSAVNPRGAGTKITSSDTFKVTSVVNVSDSKTALKISGTSRANQRFSDLYVHSANVTLVKY